jgi:hypothetical protein
VHDEPSTDAEIRRALAECMTLANIDEAMGWQYGRARGRRWRLSPAGLAIADAEIGGIPLWFRSTIARCASNWSIRRPASNSRPGRRRLLIFVCSEHRTRYRNLTRSPTSTCDGAAHRRPSGPSCSETPKDPKITIYGGVLRSKKVEMEAEQCQESARNPDAPDISRSH